MNLFEWPVRIYIEDTDAGGIVYYANYLKFFERARSEWLRAAGFNQHRLMEQGLRFVVRDLSVKYRRPALLDEEIIVTVSLDEISKAGMTLNQTALRRSDGTEEILAEATVRAACINEAGRPVAIPADVAEQLIPK